MQESHCQKQKRLIEADENKYRMILGVFLTATIAIAVSRYNNSDCPCCEPKFNWRYLFLLAYFIADRFRYLIGDIRVTSILSQMRKVDLCPSNHRKHNLSVFQFIFDAATFICLLIAGRYIMNFHIFLIAFSLAYFFATLSLIVLRSDICEEDSLNELCGISLCWIIQNFTLIAAFILLRVFLWTPCFSENQACLMTAAIVIGFIFLLYDLFHNKKFYFET